MPYVRQSRKHRFTMVPNDTAEDGTVSYRARGLLAYLLAKPDGWVPRMTDLEANGGPQEGERSIRAAIAELEGAGYLSRKRFRAPEGRWDWVWTVRDVPVPPGSANDTWSDQGELAFAQVAPGGANEGADGAPSTQDSMTQDSPNTAPAAGAPLKAVTVVEIASDIANEWWEDHKARAGRAPLQPFIAVRKVCEAAIRAGYTPEEVKAVVLPLEVVTKAGVQRALMQTARRRVNRPAEAYGASL